ncbi:FkbM family methyltransferase [Halomarina salina]|uniref:FkbM family methyltransferase n=1 Tax=Halomarina salina TaxID=1872699 RepID=A0ABD5RIP0_9EURY|nr:FkbM family methyltransferase [Halomarina salina]
MQATERLWHASRRLGVDAVVSWLYWQAKLAAGRWRHHTSVGDATATFRTTTKTEYLRAATLLGEREVVEAFVAGLDGTETVWDVGACVGTYACLAADRLANGHVVAFEPEPTNRARLVANLDANAPETRWTVEAAALTDRDGTVTLRRGPVEPGSGHHYLAPSEPTRTGATDRTSVSVPGRRGDTLVGSGTPPPDVLKLDVQGAELDVLRGLGNVLDGVERIYAELHVEKSARYETSADAVESFLEDSGFALTRFGPPDYNRAGVYHVVARR